jgi:hypothetical protein
MFHGEGEDRNHSPDVAVTGSSPVVRSDTNSLMVGFHGELKYASSASGERE